MPNKLKEVFKLKNQITYNTPNGTIKKLDLFTGKKALVGDYSHLSYKNTNMILQSLGFEITNERYPDDIIDRIKQGEKYDIIFTNNVYEFGRSGLQLLKELQKIKNFNTPIIIHTISDNINNSFTNFGFDGYLKKPIKQEDTIQVLKSLL